MSRGHEQDSIYLLRIYAVFRTNSSLSFLEKDCNEKKIDRCAVFGWNIRIFLEKYIQ